MSSILFTLDYNVVVFPYQMNITAAEAAAVVSQVAGILMDLGEDDERTDNFDIVVDIYDDVRGFVSNRELNATNNVSVTTR